VPPGLTDQSVQKALIAHCELIALWFRCPRRPRATDDSLADVRDRRNQFDTSTPRCIIRLLIRTLPRDPVRPAGLAGTPIGHVIGIYGQHREVSRVHKAPCQRGRTRHHRPATHPSQCIKICSIPSRQHQRDPRLPKQSWACASGGSRSSPSDRTGNTQRSAGCSSVESRRGAGCRGGFDPKPSRSGAGSSAPHGPSSDRVLRDRRARGTTAAQATSSGGPAHDERRPTSTTAAHHPDRHLAGPKPADFVIFRIGLYPCQRSD